MCLVGGGWLWDGGVGWLGSRTWPSEHVGGVEMGPSIGFKTLRVTEFQTSRTVGVAEPCSTPVLKNIPRK